MANIPATTAKFRIDQVATYLIAGDPEFIGEYVVLIVGNGLTGSITVKARPLIKEAMADGDNVAFQAWWYRTNAGVIATAAITATGLIVIPSGGVELALDCTALSAGNATVYVSRVKSQNL